MKIETTLFQVTLTKKMKGKYCEDVEKENTCTLLVGMYVSRVMENRKGVPQKIKKYCMTQQQNDCMYIQMAPVCQRVCHVQCSTICIIKDKESTLCARTKKMWYIPSYAVPHVRNTDFKANMKMENKLVEKKKKTKKEETKKGDWVNMIKIYYICKKI